MTKAEYIYKLQRGLRKFLSKSEVASIISDYEENFEVGLSEGKAEESLCEQFGEVDFLISEIVAGKPQRPVSIDSDVLKNCGFAAVLAGIIWIGTQLANTWLGNILMAVVAPGLIVLWWGRYKVTEASIIKYKEKLFMRAGMSVLLLSVLAWMLCDAYFFYSFCQWFYDARSAIEAIGLSMYSKLVFLRIVFGALAFLCIVRALNRHRPEGFMVLFILFAAIQSVNNVIMVMKDMSNADGFSEKMLYAIVPTLFIGGFFTIAGYFVYLSGMLGGIKNGRAV